MAFGTAIRAVFGGDTAPLQAAAKRVEAISAGVNNVLGSIGLNLSALGAVTVFAALGKGAIDLAGKLSDTSQNLGLNVISLQALEAQHKRNGVTQEQLIKGLEKTRAFQIDVINGDAKALETLAALNIERRRFVALPLDKAYAAVAGATAKATDRAKAYNAAGEIFGEKIGPRMQASLRELGEQGLPRVTAEAEKLGQIMSAETIAALDRAGDAIDDFKKRATVAVGNILVNFRTEEGLKLMGLQLLRIGASFGGRIADALSEANDIAGAIFKGTFTGVSNWFRDRMIDGVQAVGSAWNRFLPDKMEINVGNLDQFRSSGEYVGAAISRAIGDTKPTTFQKDFTAFWDDAVKKQQGVVDSLNKVDLGKDAKKLTDAGKDFEKSGKVAAGALVEAGKTVAQEIKEAVAQVRAAIAGVRGAKQFDQLDEKGLAELIRQNERQIEEIRRKIREGATPELAGSLEIGRIQSENLNAKQDLAQRTGFQSNLSRLGVDGARRLYDPFVFEELLKRFDSSRPLEQRTVDTLEEIRRGQERLLTATQSGPLANQLSELNRQLTEGVPLKLLSTSDS
jgi:hypothetical protein